MVTLRFKARSGLVMHPAKIGHPNLHYIGRKWDPSFRKIVKDARGNLGQGVDGGWVPTAEPDEITVSEDYLGHLAQAVREGALWPADEETADALEVKFDASFGEPQAEPRLAGDAKPAAPPPTAALPAESPAAQGPQAVSSPSASTLSPPPPTPSPAPSASPKSPKSSS